MLVLYTYKAVAVGRSVGRSANRRSHLSVKYDPFHLVRSQNPAKSVLHVELINVLERFSTQLGPVADGLRDNASCNKQDWRPPR